LKNLEDAFKDLSGVKPTPGGQHLELGTHNSLVSLGDDSYLELIAADPKNTKIKKEEIMLGIGTIREGKTLSWAVKVSNLEKLHETLAQAKYSVSPIRNGSRINGDKELKWRYFFLTDPAFTVSPMIAPFFIEWNSTSEHPSKSAVSGCRLLSLKAKHPNPDQFEPIFRILGFPFQIFEGGAELTSSYKCGANFFTLH
ncbi:MAG: VOC family protein, partial [Pseudobdellovibrionaceae bacterium]